MNQKTDNSVIIREAKIEDATYIALLGRITYTESHGKYIIDKSDLIPYYNEFFSVKNITKEIKNKNIVFWIAFVDNLPVGFAKISLNNSYNQEIKKASKLEKIYILNDFIGMNIGSKLQKLIFEKVNKSNCEIIWLAVYSKNTKAQEFYKKSGFKQVGFIDFKVGKHNYENYIFSKKLY